jgi:hypothetical protein
MSEMGHKQTSRRPWAMSALPLKADVLFVTACPLSVKSGLDRLFDHLVGAHDQCSGYGEADRVRS